MANFTDYANPEGLVLLRNSLRKVLPEKSNKPSEITIVIFGASGDLAQRKIYPTLWYLFKEDLLLNQISIFGYSRTKLSVVELRKKCMPFFQVSTNDKGDKLEEFWSRNYYVSGRYDQRRDIELLNQEIRMKETEGFQHNRMFYMALPLEIAREVCLKVQENCIVEKGSGWCRLILEKPFGNDAKSSLDFIAKLLKVFDESQIYWMDHLLGKEMVQNLITLRFANIIFSKIWDRNHISSIMITLKDSREILPTDGNFDDVGIIRDVMMSHLLQVFCFIAMEKPVSTSSEDIRNSKTKVLGSCLPLVSKNLIVGQYTKNPDPCYESKNGYLDSNLARENSKTPTFATAVMFINNERWDKVPFVLNCGRGMNEDSMCIRIRFRHPSGDIFDGAGQQNELVISVLPKESLHLKIMSKTPGMRFKIEETEMDLTYHSRYKNVRLPRSYERLLLEIMMGSQIHFARSDEIAQAWRIFGPLLDELESTETTPFPYMIGSDGPVQAKRLQSEYGFLS